MNIWKIYRSFNHLNSKKILEKGLYKFIILVFGGMFVTIVYAVTLNLPYYDFNNYLYAMIGTFYMQNFYREYNYLHYLALGKHNFVLNNRIRGIVFYVFYLLGVCIIYTIVAEKIEFEKFIYTVLMGINLINTFSTVALRKGVIIINTLLSFFILIPTVIVVYYINNKYNNFTYNIYAFLATNIYTFIAGYIVALKTIQHKNFSRE